MIAIGYAIEPEFYDRPYCHLKAVVNDRWLFNQVWEWYHDDIVTVTLSLAILQFYM